MERPEIDRTRALLTTLLATKPQTAGLWALGRVSHLLLLARARLEALEPRVQAHMPPRVQRFGKGLWQRITTRFPGLSDLMSELGSPPPRRSRATANGHAENAVTTQIEPPPSEGLATLIAALRDPSAEVATVAALKLGARREPEASVALRDALSNSDGYFSPLTRVAALQAFTLRLPAEPEASEVQTLITLVRDIDAEVSMAAIDAVAQRAPQALAIDCLLPVVIDETGFFLPIVRAAATRALERAGLLTTASA
jgi:hypothetical protein